MMTAKLLLSYLLTFSGSVFGLEVDTSKIDREEAYCMAKNIFYESKGEDIRGQFAVASVTLNRVDDPRYPNTVCGVVKQSAVVKRINRRVCAFSWYCERDKGDRDIIFTTRNGDINQTLVDQFQVAAMVAIAAMSGKVEDNTRGATHFHNPHTSNPAWRQELKKVMRVGNHDFYRLPPVRRNED